MAFQTKLDFFDISTTLSGLVCVSDSDGASASVVSAKDESGTIIASEVFGHTSAPTNNYVVSAQIDASKGDISLGDVTTHDGKSYVLNSFQINTTAGGAASVTASGEQVENGATATCEYEVPAFTLPVTHHAQILFSAFTLSGDGCYLNAANYTASATITKAQKNGDTLAHDVSEGQIQAAITITATGATVPTVTAGSGWTITSPLACDNPDSDYKSYTCTLTKYLTRS